MKKYGKIIAGAVSMLALYGCYSSHTIESTHEIKPVEIKPIHITIDLNVKIDKDLDDFFSDIDKKQTKSATAPVSEPAPKTDVSVPATPTPAAVAPAAAPATPVPVPASPTSAAGANNQSSSTETCGADSAGCDN